jgi:hypothetical protein
VPNKERINFLQEKAVEATKQKEETTREKPNDRVRSIKCMLM